MVHTENRYIITVTEERCKGCGYCKEICPKDVFEFAGNYNANGYLVSGVKYLERCIGCNTCVMTCPDMALTLTENE